MNAKKLIQLRKEAEAAVADMPDGEVKVKAFEVILSHLLGKPSSGSSSKHVENESGDDTKAETKKSSSKAKTANSLNGRILVLKEEDFFSSPRAISEVRDELQAHGWHYPLTTLSGALIALVQKRELRRQKIKGKDGGKPGWKYTNS
jgi:hypothetical protein